MKEVIHLPSATRTALGIFPRATRPSAHLPSDLQTLSSLPSPSPVPTRNPPPWLTEIPLSRPLEQSLPPTRKESVMRTTDKAEVKMPRHFIIVICLIGTGLGVIPLVTSPATSLFVVATILTSAGIATLLARSFGDLLSGFRRDSHVPK